MLYFAILFELKDDEMYTVNPVPIHGGWCLIAFQWRPMTESYNYSKTSKSQPTTETERELTGHCGS